MCLSIPKPNRNQRIASECVMGVRRLRKCECGTCVYWSAADGCWCFTNQLQMSTQAASRGACENPQPGRIGIKRAFIYRLGRAGEWRTPTYVCVWWPLEEKIMHPVTREKLWWRTAERAFLARHTHIVHARISSTHSWTPGVWWRIIWW
jgi:hypothetical protein